LETIDSLICQERERAVRLFFFCFFCGFILFLLPRCTFAAAATDYYNHVVFDNSITSDYYYYSSGHAVYPSSVELFSGALPVEKKNFFTPPNALRLNWRSVKGGSWETEVRVVSMRNRPTAFDGDTLYLWCYSPQAFPADDLPALQLEDEEHDFTAPVKLSISGDVPAKHWFQVRLPLSEFQTASIHPFQPSRLHSLHFSQSVADDAPHTLIIDEIKIDDKSESSPVAPEVRGTPRAPRNVQAKGYDRHIDISWDPVTSGVLQSYVIYRAIGKHKFQPVGMQSADISRYSDFVGESGVTASYRVKAVDRSYRQSAFSSAVTASTKELSDDELLNM
jgi:hypothetical protein